MATDTKTRDNNGTVLVFDLPKLPNIPSALQSKMSLPAQRRGSQIQQQRPYVVDTEGVAMAVINGFAYAVDQRGATSRNPQALRTQSTSQKMPTVPGATRVFLASAKEATNYLEAHQRRAELGGAVRNSSGHPERLDNDRTGWSRHVIRFPPKPQLQPEIHDSDIAPDNPAFLNAGGAIMVRDENGTFISTAGDASAPRQTSVVRALRSSDIQSLQNTTRRN